MTAQTKTSVTGREVTSREIMGHHGTVWRLKTGSRQDSSRIKLPPPQEGGLPAPASVLPRAGLSPAWKMPFPSPVSLWSHHCLRMVPSEGSIYLCSSRVVGGAFRLLESTGLVRVMAASRPWRPLPTLSSGAWGSSACPSPPSTHAGALWPSVGTQKCQRGVEKI